jgi:hypothetical protein
MPEASVLIVRDDPPTVEADLVAGRLTCPCCAGVLGPWGHARRRVLRMGAIQHWLVPRRGRCRACMASHVLLPDVCLHRRRDGVEVIGAALVTKAAGAGHRLIAARLGLPAETVRGWLRRFGAWASVIRTHFTRWAAALDPSLAAICPTGSALGDAVEAIAVAARAAALSLGVRPPWSLASALTAGALLANTNSPWLAPM